MPTHADVGELTPPDRTLLGPGPSNVHPRVLRAMATPLVGYLDDYYLEVMDDVQTLLRTLFRTTNEYTLAVSGTGSAAMETALTNLIEPGDTVAVPANGYFGERMGAMADRAGANVTWIDAPWGEPLALDAIDAVLADHDPAVLAFVHGETSTGVKQPNVPELTRRAHDHDALVIADTVASLGGVPFETDDWDVDVVYAGSQKCLSAPPGASPLTLNDRAMDKIRSRSEPVRSWYLDLAAVWEYWGDERNYHHTGPISTMYALREALRLLTDEGVESSWQRHRRVATAIKRGVEGMGLELNPEDEYWLPTLNAVRVPRGVDDSTVISRLLDEYGIEVVGGLGALAGEIFRVGCMGYSARPTNATYFVAAFGSILADEGAPVDVDAGLAAATRVLTE